MVLCRSLEVVFLILDEGSDRVDELQCGGSSIMLLGGGFFLRDDGSGYRYDGILISDLLDGIGVWCSVFIIRDIFSTDTR